MNYFVFRINYDEHYEKIRQELLSGRLRQGWGYEGMTLSGTEEEFFSAWKTLWPDDKFDYIKRKYNNLRIMKNIRCGDIIVIPKVSLRNKEGFRDFTIAKCVKEYEFSTLDTDFGHIIGVEPVVSFSYSLDSDTRTVSRCMTAYQSAVNNVYNEPFINAINNLLKIHSADGEYCNKQSNNILESFELTISDAIVNEHIDKINSWNPHYFEKVIEELFIAKGYHTISRNRHDGKGADIDLVFSAYAPNSLLGDIFNISELVPMPEIRIQAKKKLGIDTNDCEGIRQLINSDGYKNAINILISTAVEFTPEARKLAEKEGVILINGKEFSRLLIKYSCQFRFISE